MTTHFLLLCNCRELIAQLAKDRDRLLCDLLTANGNSLSPIDPPKGFDAPVATIAKVLGDLESAIQTITDHVAMHDAAELAADRLDVETARQQGKK